MAKPETYLTKDVFVAGSPPRVTYNPRDDRHLERELNLYLEQGPGRALSVFGPTKSGKTVLVERRLPRDEAIWIEGTDLHSVEAFWDSIVDWLGLYDLVEITRQESEGGGKQSGLSVGSSNVAKVDISKKIDSTTARGVRKTRTQAVTTVARRGLDELGVPIVIDDLHYVDEDAKEPMARAIKTAIPFCKVVLIAVPHEAFDVVRNESDMGGRVSQLRIDPWSIDELEVIAERGFDALSIDDQAGVGTTLASNSFGAPFLMQDLCYQYAVAQLGVLKTSDELVAAVEPPSWNGFFTGIANRTPATMFYHLLKGPKTRGQQRIERVFRTGGKTDIYGALLHAIAKAGKPTVSYKELAKILEADFVEPIQGQQVTASLGHMATVAKDNRGTGDAAVAYKDDDLHVLDPFLLFYLRHGAWSVEKELEDVGQDDDVPSPLA